MKIHDNWYIEEYDDGTEWRYILPAIFIDNIKKTSDNKEITMVIENIEDLIFEIRSLDVDFSDKLEDELLGIDELSIIEDYEEFVEKADSILQSIYDFCDENDVYLKSLEIKGEEENELERNN